MTLESLAKDVIDETQSTVTIPTICNILRRNDVNYVSDLISTPFSELESFRNVGIVRLHILILMRAKARKELAKEK